MIDTIFVYGTLRKSVEHSMTEYFHSQFSLIGEGYIHGDLYDLGEYPGVRNTHSPNKVFGEIYRIREFADLPASFAALDLYEDFDAALPKRSLFLRRATVVITSMGNMTCWVYWLNHLPSTAIQLVEGDYLAYLSSKNKINH